MIDLLQLLQGGNNINGQLANPRLFVVWVVAVAAIKQEGCVQHFVNQQFTPFG